MSDEKQKLWDELDKVKTRALNFSKYTPRGRRLLNDRMMAIGLAVHNILSVSDHFIFPDTFGFERIDRDIKEASKYLEEFGYKIVKIEED